MNARVDQWSLTPADNANQDGIPMFEGMMPSSVNDAIRVIMSEVKRAQDKIYTLAPSGLGGDYDSDALNERLQDGGIIWLDVGVYTFTKDIIAEKPFSLRGAGASINNERTHLNFVQANGNDKFKIGGVAAQCAGPDFRDLTMATPLSTGGSVLYFENCANVRVDNVWLITLASTEDGIKGHKLNGAYFSGVLMAQPVRRGFYFWGEDNARRSDVIDFLRCNVTGDSLGAHSTIPDAIYLDGYVNTIVGHSVRAVACGRGIHSVNTLGTGLRAEFMEFHDLEVDFPYYEAIRNEGHSGLNFTNLYAHGSITESNIYLGHISGVDTLDNVAFTGGQCTGAKKYGIDTHARYVKVLGMEISGNGAGAYNTYSGIILRNDSYSTTIIGNHIGQRSGYQAATQKYGVEVETGTFDYIIAHNDLRDNITAPLKDDPNLTCDSRGIIAPNMGMTTPESHDAKFVAPGFTITMGKALGEINAATMILDAAATLATGEIVLDATPYNGQRFKLWTVWDITALTVTPRSGALVFDSPTSLGIESGFELVYNGTTNQWFRIG